VRPAPAPSFETTPHQIEEWTPEARSSEKLS